MPFDDAKYFANATRGQVGGLAIKLGVILGHISSALQNLSKDQPIDDQLAELQNATEELNSMFDELTGWCKE